MTVAIYHHAQSCILLYKPTVALHIAVISQAYYIPKRHCPPPPITGFTLMWDWGVASGFDVDTGSTLPSIQTGENTT